ARHRPDYKKPAGIKARSLIEMFLKNTLVRPTEWQMCHARVRRFVQPGWFPIPGTFLLLPCFRRADHVQKTDSRCRIRRAYALGTRPAGQCLVESPLRLHKYGCLCSHWPRVRGPAKTNG